MKKIKVLSVERSLHNVYMSTYKIMNKIFDFEIITCKQKNRPGLRVTHVSEKFLVKNEFGSYYKELSKQLDKKKFDIIHCRNYYAIRNIQTIKYALKNNKPIIITEEQQQDPVGKLNKILFRIYLPYIRHLINKNNILIMALTSLSKEYLTKRGFKRVKKIILPYQIKQKAKNQKITEKIKIICVARFEWLKAHFVLVNAINYLIKTKKLSKKDVEITFLGKGNLEENLRKKIKQYGLAEIFHFKGHIPFEQISKEYFKNNLFILPSRIEMVGAVVGEAMEHSLPIIVSDKVGSKDLVKDKVNGYIFKSLDYEDLARKILLLKDKKKRESFGKKSYELLKTNNNLKIISEQLLTIFNEELNKNIIS